LTPRQAPAFKLGLAPLALREFAIAAAMRIQRAEFRPDNIDRRKMYEENF